MFNEKWNLPVNNNEFLLNCSEWYYFFNEYWFFSNNLPKDGNLCMTCNFDYSFLNIRLNKVASLHNNFLGILFINRFLNFNNNSFRFLAIAMLWIVNRLFDHNFCDFCNFMPLNYRFFNFHKFNLLLNNNMMDRSLNNFKFWLFIDFWNCLLDFKYFTYFFVDILWNFFLHDYLSCFDL